ncbi:hypothetical protein IPH19_03810 [Candidatus Uhrbacteria bacterium]|nr:MAG: hypothetical protein IPH19_03810 [Candidatus Uhrbacteria bacterium]
MGLNIYYDGMFLRGFAIFLLICGLLPIHLVLAQNASSTNFQNTDSSILPLIVNTQSGNFQIDGSVQSIVGSVQSPSFLVESGAQSTSGTTPTVVVIPPPSGGGGGGGGLPLPQTGPRLEPAPTIDPRDWTYKTTAIVQGSRGVDGAAILLNSSDIGVIYPNEQRWERSLPLGLGDNLIQIQAKLGDRVSIVVIGMVHRRLIGDVNDDRVVDDVDLSLFTRHWRRYDRQSDFNEDGMIDDIDLSLLASHWGRRY